MTSESGSAPEIKALYVALIALSKAVAALQPGYEKHLHDALRGAEAAGVSAEELRLLRMMINSADATAEARRLRYV